MEYCLLRFFQRPKRDLDAYDEVLKWQREIQERSVEETQNILNINLEQILKVYWSFVLLEKGTLMKIVNIENLIYSSFIHFRCARAWNPCLH